MRCGSLMDDLFVSGVDLQRRKDTNESWKKRKENNENIKNNVI